MQETSNASERLLKGSSRLKVISSVKLRRTFGALKTLKATEARATQKTFLRAVSAPRPTHGRVAAMCARRWAPDARSLKRNSPTSSLYITHGKEANCKKRD